MRSIEFRGSGSVERSCIPPHASMPQGIFKFSLFNLIVYMSQIVSDESEKMHKNSAVLFLTFGPDNAYRLSWNQEKSACVRIRTTRGVKVQSIQILWYKKKKSN